MKTLDRAIFLEWLRGFSVALALIVLTLFLVQSSRISSLLFTLSPEAGPFLHTLLLLLPSYMVLSIPIAHMFSCLALALRYRREGELRALQTAGAGFARLLKPLLLAGIACGALCAVLTLHVEPRAKSNINALLAQMAAGAVQSRIAAGEIVQITPDNAFFAAERDGRRLKHIFMAQNGRDGERVLWAENAEIKPDAAEIVLEMHKGGFSQSAGNTINGSFQSFSLHLPLPCEQSGDRIFPPLQSTPSMELALNPDNGENTFELLRRFTAPLATPLSGASAVLAAFLLPAHLPLVAWLFSLLLLALFYLAGRGGEILALDKSNPALLCALAPLLVLLLVLAFLIAAQLRRREK